MKLKLIKASQRVLEKCGFLPDGEGKEGPRFVLEQPLTTNWMAVENTDGFREYEKRAIESMLESDCFVLTWDIGHSKAIRETDVPFNLSHREKLKHFHIHDGCENPPKNHLTLGDGEINLPERLKVASECNARCVLETKHV